MAAPIPSLRPFIPDAIPAELKLERRWAPWCAVWNPKRGKWDKIPHRADMPNVGLSTARPEKWFSFDAALVAYQRNPKLFAGLGYVVTGQQGLVATDLDNCIDAAGSLAPWAQEVVNAIGGYWERSPSGNGLRGLAKGDLATDWTNHEVGVEVYGGNEARFLTVTGDVLPGAALELAPVAGTVLSTLAARYAREKPSATVIDLNMPEVLDELLLPPLSSLNLPDATVTFLESGEHRGDRSRELFAAAVALYSAGLGDDTAFSILANSPHALEVALDHRRQDHDRALMYLWREHCCKGRARAGGGVASPEDFEALEAPAAMLTPLRFAVQQACDFASGKPPEWIIKGVVPRAELLVLFGESGSGKSFIGLDMGMSIARGIEWRGHRVRQGRVVYVAAEGAGGFRNRMQAYARHHEIDLAGLPFGVINAAPNLLLKDDALDVSKAILAGGKADVVIVDTFAQTTPGANENAGEDMGKALAHCRGIHRATGALVILIHHAGKDLSKGARGWSGLRAAADAEIEITRDGDYRALRISKQKDGEDGAEMGFRLVPMAIGMDEDGDEITSCVVEYDQADAPKVERRREPKGARQRMVLRIATDLMGLDGAGVPVSDLVDAVVAEIPFDQASGKHDRRREVTLQALESLVDARQVSVARGLVEVL